MTHLFGLALLALLLSCTSTRADQISNHPHMMAHAESSLTELAIDEFLTLSALRMEIEILGQQFPFTTPYFDAISPNESLPVMKNYLRRELSKGSATELLQWLRSPLARKMISPVYRLVRYEDIREFIPPSDSIRTRFAQRLDQALQLSEKLIPLDERLTRRLVSDRASPAGEEAKNKITKDIKQGVTEKLLYQYRWMTNAELQQFVDFLESPLGRWYLAIRDGALDVALSPAQRKGRDGLYKHSMGPHFHWNPALTQTHLDGLVASQRYDQPIQFLRVPQDTSVRAWLVPWWTQQSTAGHVPLIYEMARQLLRAQDKSHSMEIFADAYVAAMLDGSLCADATLRQIRTSLLQDYLRIWDDLPVGLEAPGDFKTLFIRELTKALKTFKTATSRPSSAWACRSRMGSYDHPIGTLIPQDQWGAVQAKTRDHLAEMAAQDVDAQFAADYLPAAWDGKTEFVKRLLDRGVNILTRSTEQNHKGWSALHLAARTGQTDVMDLLLARGLDANLTADGNYTPLHIAANQGQTEGVAVLLKHGAQVNARCIRGTALQTAVIEGYADIVELLLQGGANQQLEGGDTALHLFSQIASFRRGHPQIIETLIRYGADVNAPTKYGTMPLDNAREEALAPLILHGARLSKENPFSYLQKAARSGNADALRYAERQGLQITMKNQDGETLLLAAADSKQRGALDYLLSKGLDPNEASRSGRRPLWIAARGCKSDLTKSLLIHKADPKFVLPQGQTILHMVLEPTFHLTDVGCEDVVMQLLDAGADPNVHDQTGKNLLHKVLERPQLLSRLLKLGVNPREEGRSGETLLHDLASSADSLPPTLRGEQLAATIDTLVKGGANPNAKDQDGRTPLHQAAEKGNFRNKFEVANALVRNGARVEMRDKQGQTALDVLLKQPWATDSKQYRINKPFTTLLKGES